MVIRAKAILVSLRNWFVTDPLVIRVWGTCGEVTRQSSFCLAIGRGLRWYRRTPQAQDITKQTVFLALIACADFLLRLPPAGRMVYVLPVFALTRSAGLHSGVGMAAAAAVVGTEMDRVAGFHDTWLLSGIIRFLLLVIVAFKVDSMVDRLKETTDNASHDSLTGVLNRFGFAMAGEEILNRAISSGSSLVVAQVDLDDFKLINDLYGHGFGDRVLKILVECLAPAVAGSGALGRVGGDEFQLVFPDTHKIIVEKAIQRALNRFTDSTLVLGHRASFTAGFAELGEDGATLDTLFAAADRSMYRRKILKARPSVRALAVDVARAL